MGFDRTFCDVGCDEQAQIYKDDFETLWLSVVIHKELMLEIVDVKLQHMRGC